MICGNGFWNNIKAKIYFSIRFDGDKKLLVLRNLNIIWRHANMHNDILFAIFVINYKTCEYGTQLSTLSLATSVVVSYEG